MFLMKFVHLVRIVDTIQVSGLLYQFKSLFQGSLMKTQRNPLRISPLEVRRMIRIPAARAKDQSCGSEADQPHSDMQEAPGHVQESSRSSYAIES